MKQVFIDAFEYKAWANQEILDFGARQFEQLPLDDGAFLLRILNHTAIVDALFVARILRRPAPFDADNTVETPTFESLRRLMSKTDRELIEIAKSVEALDQQIGFTFSDGDAGRMTIAEIFLHLLTHGSNHRGMASRTLANHQLDRPRDTFTRFLHHRDTARRDAAQDARDT